MGLRLAKTLGYGLDDVADTTLNGRDRMDPRLARHPGEAWRWTWGEGDPELEAERSRDFVAYVRAVDGDGDPTTALMDSVLANHLDAEIADPKGWRASDCIEWNPEYGLETALVIVPPGETRWRRSGDEIDGWEYALRHGNERTALVERLPCSPGIDAGLLMDDRTGALVPPHLAAPLRRLLDAKDRDPELALPDALFRQAGFADEADMRAYAVPYVPREVRLFCRWIGLFRDPATVHALRPVLYTHWR